ncbi:MAG: hypothetical protein ACTHMS_23640 [Jatrophihabitans sp.]|uniref:hypothetical protein n=1 Tax=Jatrophihabitans sp. TaxID=1932789 RepID=UPI003F81B710
MPEPTREELRRQLGHASAMKAKAQNDLVDAILAVDAAAERIDVLLERLASTRPRPSHL